MPAPRLRADIVEQYGILAGLPADSGGAVPYIKPHGALYNRMGVDEAVAAVVVEAVKECGITLLVAQPGTVVVGLATRAGLEVVAEAFADRGYLADGRLVPRGDPDSLVPGADSESVVGPFELQDFFGEIDSQRRH